MNDPSEQVFLLLFGTGARNRSVLANVNARIGGEDVEVLYVGAQGGFAGLDQVNLRLSQILRGRGDVDVELTVDGRQGGEHFANEHQAGLLQSHFFLWRHSPFSISPFSIFCRRKAFGGCPCAKLGMEKLKMENGAKFDYKNNPAKP